MYYSDNQLINQINLGEFGQLQVIYMAPLHQNLSEIVFPQMTHVQGVVSYIPVVSEIVHHVCSVRAVISHSIAIKTAINDT